LIKKGIAAQEACMGLVLDIYIEFFVRAIVRLFRARGSRSWPVIKAEITGANYRAGGFGCAIVEITYQYRFQGELYTGMNAKPFVWDSSAKEYVERYSAGSDLLVQVRPGSPESSVARDKDEYLHAHGYRLES
jgi:hypothetical protein